MRKKVKTMGAAALVLAMIASVMPTNIGRAYTPGDYSYFDGYTLGWKDGIVAYKDGARTTLAEAGVTIFDQKTDRPFQSENEQEWDADVIELTQPVKYTTEDGVAHDVESMLTNFDFIADPTAIDNTEVDGKLYVYGTTEGFSYNNGVMSQNGYDNHSLTILSTSDMVNWTDEGFMDTQNLTNEVSDSDDKVKAGWAVKAWAPSGLAYDGDGDGELEYYLFHTNSGAVGYVMSDSPTGPWRSPLNTALFTQGSPGCKDVKWCFDPAVLRDSEGNAYIYFGGGIWDGKNEVASHPDGIAHPKTGRVCKLGFNENGEVYADGDAQEMDTYYLFEDSEINQFNGKYYYSYCVNFQVPGGDPWVTSGSIGAYVSTDPMDIAFDPAGPDGDQYTDGKGIYHHFLGTILNNPSVIYGESYNNHHHMQSFKGHNYIFYHSTVLNNMLHRINKQYRCLHVDEIDVDAETDEISIEPSYEGAKQIENFNPFT
ncbi:MAG: family 43 glycosylhydrolase, partial [Lachnospiraceae bacterium]|nr:family 43 glycosylhydrolase [Lachnospiraceae bacterium]